MASCSRVALLVVVLLFAVMASTSLDYAARAVSIVAPSSSSPHLLQHVVPSSYKRDHSAGHNEDIPTPLWEELKPPTIGSNVPQRRFLPAQGLFNNSQWTIVGGDFHETATILNDIWTYDFESNNWVERVMDSAATSAPVNSWRSGVVDQSGTFSLFGGFGMQQSLADTIYQLKLGETVWTALLGKLPEYPAGFSTILDQDGLLWIFGGTLDGIVGMNKLRYYSFTTESWTPVIPQDGDNWPTVRYFHTGVRTHGEWWIFGGAIELFAGNKLNDLWRFSFNTRTWNQVAVTDDYRPSARSLHAATVTPDEEYMFVYGGVDSRLTSSDELWMFHFGSRTWAFIPARDWPNGGRDGHVMQIWQDQQYSLWLYVWGGDLTSETGPRQQNDMHRLLLDELFDVTWPSHEVDRDDDDDDNGNSSSLGVRIALAVGWIACVVLAAAFAIVLVLYLRLRKQGGSTSYVQDDSL